MEIILGIIVLVAICMGIYYLFVEVFSFFKNLVLNNPGYTILFIIILLTLFIVMLIIFIIILIKFKREKNKIKNNFLKEKNEILSKFEDDVNKLKYKINIYENIFPNLKNWSHEINNNINNLEKSIGDIGEVQVSNILKKIAKKYNMVHFDNVHLSYSYFNEETKWKIFQIDHLLVKNNFIFVIETKNWNIPSYFDINKNIWYQYHGDKKVKLESPIEQNKSHIYNLKKMFEKDKINLDNIFIINIIVIVQNNLTILKNEYDKLNDNAGVIHLTELENEIFKHSKQVSFFEDNKKINIIVMSILNKNKIENIEKHKKQLNYK